MRVKNPSEKEIDEILRSAKIIAVIGMSKNPEKDAHTVPEYLKSKGYSVIPVNPTADQILGEKAYKRLRDVPGEIHIVDVFRPSEDVPNYVVDVLEKKPKVFWLQLGIHNVEAEEEVASNGIRVIYDRCIRVEYQRMEQLGRK